MAVSVSDIPSIFSMLSGALSGDKSVRKPSENALSEFESRPGFCSCLLEIITSEHLASHGEVRLLATVYFKNSVNRYWRQRRDSYGISNEEKAYLRKKLLTDLREENYQIALQRAILISKIARLDYPKDCVCTSVIIGGEEKTKEEYSYTDADSLGSNNISEAFGSSSTTEIRRRQLKESDPIKHLSLEDILRKNLRVCATIHGESYFNSSMSRIHQSSSISAFTAAACSEDGLTCSLVRLVVYSESTPAAGSIFLICCCKRLR